MRDLTKFLRWSAVFALLALGTLWAGIPRPALAQTQGISRPCADALAAYSAEWSAIFSGTVSPESVASIVPSLGAWLSNVESVCTTAELESLDSQSLAQIQFLLGSLAKCDALGGTWSWEASGCKISVDSSIVIGENQSLARLFHLINYGTIDNYGTISLGGSVFAISNYGTINNHRAIDITSGVPAFGNLGFTGHVNGFLLNYGTINNHDTIRTEGERFTDGDNNGIDEFGRLVNFGVINNDGRLLSNGGIIANDDSGTEGTVNNSGEITNSSLFSNDGTINNQGELTSTSLFGNVGTINNTGMITVYSRFSNGDTFTSGTIHNDSVINIFGLFGNSGLIRNSGTLYLEPMSVDDLGNFVVDGEIIQPFPYFYNVSGTVEQDCNGVFTAATTWQFEGNDIVNICPEDTPPAITPMVSGALGDNGWYTSNVTVTWTVTDAESAITSTSGCDQTVISGDTPGLPLTCTATSTGGTAGQSITIARDATSPTVTVTGVAEGATYVLGAVPDAGCETADALSGVATPAGLTLSGGAPDGSGVVTATCDGGRDHAGNQGSARATYTVTTPTAAADTLEDEILALASTDVLKRGEAKRLTTSLDKVLRSLEKNRTSAACRQLADFIADVNRSTPDPLDAVTAESLISAAEAIRTALGCDAVGPGHVGSALPLDADASERVFLPLVKR